MCPSTFFVVCCQRTTAVCALHASECAWEEMRKCGAPPSQWVTQFLFANPAKLKRNHVTLDFFCFKNGSSQFLSFQKNQQETTGNIELQSTCDQDQLRVQSKLFEEMFGCAWETGDSSVVEDFQNGLADCGSTLVLIRIKFIGTKPTLNGFDWLWQADSWMCTKLQNAYVLFEKQVDITQISPNELWIAWGRFVFCPHPFKRRLGKLFFFYMRMMNSDLHYQ